MELAKDVLRVLSLILIYICVQPLNLKVDTIQTQMRLLIGTSCMEAGLSISYKQQLKHHNKIHKVRSAPLQPPITII